MKMKKMRIIDISLIEMDYKYKIEKSKNGRRNIILRQQAF